MSEQPKRCPCGKPVRPKHRPFDPSPRYCSEPCRRGRNRRLSAARHPGTNREACRRYYARNRAAKKGKTAAYKRGRCSLLRLLKFLARLEKVEVSMAETTARGAGTLEVARVTVRSMTTELLRKELETGLRVVTGRLVRLAVVLEELERRGEKVEADPHVLGMLRRIAAGELLPETVVRFAGKPRVLARVGALPPGEQEELLGAGDDEVKERLGKPARRTHADRGRREDADPVAALRKRILAAAAQDAAEILFELFRDSEDRKAIAERLWRMASKGRVATA